MKTINKSSFYIIIYLILIAALALFNSDAMLLIAGIIAGILFVSVIRTQKKMRIDERDVLVQDKAARITYAIFAPTLGSGACILLIYGRLGFFYLEALGLVLAYLSLFLIVLYAISYFFINREYGGGHHEE